MIKNLPFQFKDLEIHIQKILTRLGIVEEKIDTIQTEVGNLNTEVDALAVKQNNQKLIQIVATQRTFKTTAGDADIVATDGSVGALNAWVQRQLNYAVQTPNSTDYFVFNSPTSYGIQIKKPGRYKIDFTGHFRRTNFNQIMAEYLPPSGNSIFKQVRNRCSTTATAVGADCAITSNMILDIDSGKENGFIYLSQWVETNTSNEKYGLWYTRGVAGAPQNYSDTCSLAVTLITE